MKLHLLGLPHTITDEAHSHCAFTGKIIRFPVMMESLGYEVIHYGVAGAEVQCEHVDLMTQDEQNVLRGHDGSDSAKFYADDANTDNPLYKTFMTRLRKELIERVTQADLVLLQFGYGHNQALAGLPFKIVEHGIGYPDLSHLSQFKIFESEAWRHYHQGKAGRVGNNYEWVIPSYFDINAWKFQPDPDPNMVVFLGRITESKGLLVVVEVAKRRPDLRFIICGQGDPTPYLTEPNIVYLPPMTGKIRSMLLGTASVVLMPTTYTEPFGAVNVEAQLCGTPVLSTSYGAFTETIEDEVTGFRCHTLGDFLAALDRAPELNRKYISDRARKLYGYERVGKMYDRVFQQIQDLSGEGWYSPRSVFQRPTLKLLAGGRAG